MSIYTEAQKVDRFNVFTDEVLIHKSNTTADIYTKNYIKLITALNKPLINNTDDKIIETIDGMDLKPSSKRQLVNFVIVYLKWSKTHDISKLDTYRSNLFKQEEKTLTTRKKITLSTLPKIKDFKAYTNKLYDDKKYQEFIINYLLMNYNVRNMDLDLQFILERVGIDNNDNYLHISKNGVYYIRNKYKTFNIYGTKEYKITNKKFVDAVKTYYINRREEMGNKPVYLLSTQLGDRIHPTSMGKYIFTRTFNKLTESKINDMMVSQIKSFKDIKKLKQIGDRRGTDIKTLIKYYNLNVPVEDV